MGDMLCYAFYYNPIYYRILLYYVCEGKQSNYVLDFFNLSLGCEIGLSSEMGFRWVRVQFGDASWISRKYKIYVIFRYKMIGDIKKMSLSYAKCPSGDLHNG